MKFCLILILFTIVMLNMASSINNDDLEDIQKRYLFPKRFLIPKNAPWISYDYWKYLKNKGGFYDDDSLMNL
ncbi:hypothetical protein A3Q56_04785 [Intoshia linei]|uniref:Uncharacterized protein n=1 Tax=Intoshia linei TaxID=1819745 RepID=A0A177B1E0_9BILA|nr:hypothetical protein A3Q56_04785 [Intoshia linei]